jgi:hypothetical protein
MGVNSSKEAKISGWLWLLYKVQVVPLWLGCQQMGPTKEKPPQYPYRDVRN